MRSRAGRVWRPLLRLRSIGDHAVQVESRWTLACCHSRWWCVAGMLTGVAAACGRSRGPRLCPGPCSLHGGVFCTQPSCRPRRDFSAADMRFRGKARRRRRDGETEGQLGRLQFARGWSRGDPVGVSGVRCTCFHCYGRVLTSGAVRVPGAGVCRKSSVRPVALSGCQWIADADWM